MGKSFDVRKAPTQNVLMIRHTCAMKEIGAAIGRLLPEVYGWAMQHGVQVVGPAFTRYTGWSDPCTFDVGFVVDRKVDTNDPRVIGGELGGRDAAYAMHVGAYDAIGETYTAMGEWIKEHDYVPDTTVYEEYLDPPGTPIDKQRTEVWWPLQGH